LVSRWRGLGGGLFLGRILAIVLSSLESPINSNSGI
jgi:hypothetical protein